MSIQDDISKRALENYTAASAWPDQDAWHKVTYTSEKRIIEKWLDLKAADDMMILNAGSGGTEYKTKGSLIHMDIVESYVVKFEKHIVGSIEDINLPDASVDGIICVGSVLNYTDVQRAVAEFSRVLKAGGFFIIEFERSNSAEFLGTSYHGKTIFAKEYNYNGQNHLLWLYDEKHVRQLLEHYNLYVQKSKRVHCISSLLNRFGLSEERASHYAKWDEAAQKISYPIAHNILLLGSKGSF